MEEVQRELTEAIVRQQAVLSEAIGDRPYGTERLTDEEQLERYNQLVRDNVEAWAGLLRQHGRKKVFDYVEHMEGIRTRDMKENGVRQDGAIFTT